MMNPSPREPTGHAQAPSASRYSQLTLGGHLESTESNTLYCFDLRTRASDVAVPGIAFAVAGALTPLAVL